MTWGQKQFAGAAYLGAGLYLGVLLFNLCLTFYIGETLLGIVGVFIYLPLATLAGVYWYEEEGDREKTGGPEDWRETGDRGRRED